MSKDTKLLRLVKILNNNKSLNGLFKYNSMTKDIEFTRKTDIDDWEYGNYLTDDDLIYIKYYLSKTADYEYDKTCIEEAILIVAKRLSYNPLHNYLKSLKWDNKKRLDTWLIDICGIDDNKYTRAISRKFLCGAIARAITPGCKFDYMLILEGDQGIGKSTLVEILGGDFYLDTHISGSDSKNDLVNIMRTAWIMEISDMAGFRKSDVEYLKAFITRKVDRIRLPYDRRPQDLPRQCVMIGTHNPSGHNEYFRDDTGNRRFWPVECRKVDLRKMIEIRDQLFAEAFIVWEKGEILFLEDRDTVNILSDLHKAREQKSPLEEIIEQFVSDKYSVNNIEIIRDGMRCDMSRISAMDLKGRQTLIGQWMRKHRWYRRKDLRYYNPRYIPDEQIEESEEEQWK